jgi:hypothetical protein
VEDKLYHGYQILAVGLKWKTSSLGGLTHSLPLQNKKERIPMKNVISSAMVASVFAVLVAVLFVAPNGNAQTNGEKSVEVTNKDTATTAVEKAKEGKLNDAIITAATITDPVLRKTTMGDIGDQDATKFWSVWGVGLVVNFDTGHRKPIISASIVNGIVRVEEEDDVKYGLGLEVHRFIWGTSWGATARRPWSGAMALGPYVSALPGTNNVIDALGAGLVFGFIGGRSSESESNKFSMNVAIGMYVDPGTRVLADGFEDGKAPPAGETSVRYKTVTQYGVQGVLSFSYNF